MKDAQKGNWESVGRGRGIGETLLLHGRLFDLYRDDIYAIINGGHN